MRKKYYIILIMLLLLSCFGLTACQNIDSKKAVQTSVETAELEEQDELVFAVNVDSSVSETFLHCVWMNVGMWWPTVRTWSCLQFGICVRKPCLWIIRST